MALAASYCCKVSTGHKLVLCENEGKTNSLKTLPCENYFVRVAGRKVTPSGRYLRLSSWSAAKSAEWDGLVNDKNITNLKVSSLNDKETR